MSGRIAISLDKSIRTRSSTFDVIRDLLIWGFQQDPPLIHDKSLEESVFLTTETGMGYLTLERCSPETLTAIRELLLAGASPSHPTWESFEQRYLPKIRDALQRGDPDQIAQCNEWEDAHRAKMREVADAIESHSAQRGEKE